MIEPKGGPPTRHLRAFLGQECGRSDSQIRASGSGPRLAAQTPHDEAGEMGDAARVLALRPGADRAWRSGMRPPCPHASRGVASRGDAAERQTWNELPQPQLLETFGLLKANPRLPRSSMKSITVPSR